MNHSTILTQLEFVLLQLVAKGEGKWSWYEIAQALSRLDVPREPDMMQVLKKLAAEGFLNREVQPGSPRDRWELTLSGQNKIRMMPNSLKMKDIVIPAEYFEEMRLQEIKVMPLDSKTIAKT